TPMRFVNRVSPPAALFAGWIAATAVGQAPAPEPAPTSPAPVATVVPAPPPPVTTPAPGALTEPGAAPIAAPPPAATPTPPPDPPARRADPGPAGHPGRAPPRRQPVRKHGAGPGRAPHEASLHRPGGLERVLRVGARGPDGQGGPGAPRARSDSVALGRGAEVVRSLDLHAGAPRRPGRGPVGRLQDRALRRGPRAGGPPAALRPRPAVARGSPA